MMRAFISLSTQRSPKRSHSTRTQKSRTITITTVREVVIRITTTLGVVEVMITVHQMQGGKTAALAKVLSSTPAKKDNSINIWAETPSLAWGIQFQRMLMGRDSVSDVLPMKIAPKATVALVIKSMRTLIKLNHG